MLHFIKNLFGKEPDFKRIYQGGAIIIDVRSVAEFKTGHIKDALNIPVNLLKTKISDLKKHNKPIITCCLSGTGSGMARIILRSEGLEAYNGGPWTRLENEIQLNSL